MRSNADRDPLRHLARTICALANASRGPVSDVARIVQTADPALNEPRSDWCPGVPALGLAHQALSLLDSVPRAGWCGRPAVHEREGPFQRGLPTAGTRG